MDGVVKTSILTAISAITVYAGLFYYLNGDDDKNKNNNNSNKKGGSVGNSKIRQGQQNKNKKKSTTTNDVVNNSTSSKKKKKQIKSTTTTTTTALKNLNISYSSSSSSSTSSSSSSDGLGIPYGSSSNSINSNYKDDSIEIDTEEEENEESHSHEISTSTSSGSENDFTQNSPRTLQDHLKILKSDDLSNHMAIKKLDSIHVLLTIVSYSESLALLSSLNSVSIVVDSLNSLLALEMISVNQNSLLNKLGILLGNLLQYPNNQKKIIETRFISTLVNLINDDDNERSDFSLFCLMNLSSNEECGTEIILSQGIKEIITLLESSKKSISLKKQCLHIILNMYLESKNLREMISSENEQLLNILKSIVNQKSDISELASKILQIDNEHQKNINQYNTFEDDEEEEEEDDDE